MSVVVGTAGHIDHGKTALLRALTGIDADRLPEERRRGMTIEVGYAHLRLADGGVLDFVDVPGHDRLIGNMLVGAGEIDAALVVVAVDDGPRAQTLEHLELLDGLGLRAGLAVVTKADLGPPGDPRRGEVVAAVAGLLARTSLAGAPIVVASAVSGEGLDALRTELAALRDRVRAGAAAPVPDAAAVRLAIDRAFSVRGRGAVVTGSLRGGAVEPGATLRLEPGGRRVRVREVQVHGVPVERRAGGGRTALNLAAIDAAELARGMVVTNDPEVVGTDRLLVALRPPTRLARPGRDAAGHRDDRSDRPPDGAHLRLHLGTAQVEAIVGRRGREAVDLDGGGWTAILRLAHPVAAAPGDRLVLREPGTGRLGAVGRVLEPTPARGVVRHRARPDRLLRLARAIGDDRPEPAAVAAARLDLAGGRVDEAGRPDLAPDVLDGIREAALTLVDAHHRAEPDSPGLLLAELRRALVGALGSLVRLDAAAAGRAAAAVVEALVGEGRLAREADRVRSADRAPGIPPELAAAMDRLERALAVPAPPPFGESVRAAGCPPDGVRALEQAGRIVRLEADLAWSAAAYAELEAIALDLARRHPLTPAALRDATGASRRFVMPLLEDLGRRGVLRRTPDGHVPGPRAPQ